MSKRVSVGVCIDQFGKDIGIVLSIDAPSLRIKGMYKLTHLRKNKVGVTMELVRWKEGKA